MITSIFEEEACRFFHDPYNPDGAESHTIVPLQALYSTNGLMGEVDMRGIGAVDVGWVLGIKRRIGVADNLLILVTKRTY